MSDAWSEIYTAPEPFASTRAVPWAFKDWSQFTDTDKAALNRHMAQLTPEQRRDYELYLSSQCGVPKNFLSLGKD